MTVLGPSSSASPRISGAETPSSATIYLSRVVRMVNVPGLLVLGMQVNDSSGEMASRVADGMPNLSQLRYL